uniref:Uncharacterized protein n=1 Tax=Ditylenchus dipsaci TaxID=166011 RepID=A0A915E5U5_9BILA
MDKIDGATDDFIHASDNWSEDSGDWMDNENGLATRGLDEDNFWEDYFEIDYDEDDNWSDDYDEREDYGDDYRQEDYDEDEDNSEDYSEKDYDGDEDYDDGGDEDYGGEDYGNDTEDVDFDIDGDLDAAADTVGDAAGEVVESVVGAGEGIGEIIGDVALNILSLFSFLEVGICNPHDGDGVDALLDAWTDLQVRGEIEDGIRIEDFLEVDEQVITGGALTLAKIVEEAVTMSLALVSFACVLCLMLLTQAVNGENESRDHHTGNDSNPFWLRYVNVPPKKYMIWTVDTKTTKIENFNLTYLISNGNWKSVVEPQEKFKCPDFAHTDKDKCYSVAEKVEMAELSYKPANQSAWSSGGTFAFEENFFSRHHPSSHTNQTDHQLLLSLKSELGQMVHRMEVISKTDHAENEWTRIFNLIISAIELLLLGLGPAFLGLIAALQMAAKRRLRRRSTQVDDWPVRPDDTATIDTRITEGPQLENDHGENETGTLISGLGRHEDE